MWVDGVFLNGSYSNWGKNEPSNGFKQDCTLMMGELGGKWKDHSCDGYMQYICERKVGKHLNIYTVILFIING